MTDKSILTHINDIFFNLTKSEKRVATFVLEEPRKTQYMSISELAKSSGVADATVTRFCYKLGLRNFHAFKLEIAKATALWGNLTEETVSEQDFNLPENCADLSAIVKKLYINHTEALRQTREMISHEAICKATQSLHNAKNVYCMGQGGSMVVAAEAYSLFLTISSKFSLVSDSHLQAITAANLGEEDVILFFSYSGATRDLIDLLSISDRVKCTVILVTRHPESAGAKKADIVIQCGSTESILRSGSVSARIAQLFVIDTLYESYTAIDTIYYRKRKTKTVEALTDKWL